MRPHHHHPQEPQNYEQVEPPPSIVRSQHVFRPTNLRSPIGSPALPRTHARHRSRNSDIDINSIRSSRASSTVSTRTKVSINTIQEDGRNNEDARSIDLVIGGQSYRIARDGSRVTSSVNETLPPYSPLGHAVITQDDVISLMSSGHDSLGESSGRGRSRSSSMLSDATETAEQDEGQDIADRTSYAIEHYGAQATIEEETEVVEDLAGHTEYAGSEAPSPAPSQGDTSRPISTASTVGMHTPTTRRQGFWIVSVISGLLGGSRNNEEIAMKVADADNTRTSSGDTTDILPPLPDMVNADQAMQHNMSAISDVQPESDSGATTEALSPAAGPAMRRRQTDAHEELRSHYVNMIRTIDHEYRKTIHDKDQELATLRTRLNEVDQVYRTELRARDFTIDDLAQRLQHFEIQLGGVVERARHEVEDLWEQRWKDRDHHLVERMRRIESESERRLDMAVGNAIKERDGMWMIRVRNLLRRVGVQLENGNLEWLVDIGDGNEFTRDHGELPPQPP